ncbi:hypothetical protein [Pseudoalteromonas sp. 10-33]|uniref:hypothetical protein n=1 Tax=Pseudoalteromonas sp. 10-33 TaxID=1761890 RepID=UPI000731F440|nr:hypothetical protein [Pseudoalteromonas sp. 10-33]KTF14414.1 hypothetical protein ATS76_04680 [Pseudoalteromonas sp. 10-33]
MKLLVTILINVFLSGCTVAGVLIDGHAQNNEKLNQNMNSIARSDPYKDPFKPIAKDREGFSFTKLGLKIDSALVDFVSVENNQQRKVCRKVGKSLKECVELENQELHTNEATQLKTDYEIISVGQ